MSQVSDARTSAVKRAMGRARAIFDGNEVSKSSIQQVASALTDLAQSKELFSEDEFPAPAEGSEGHIYLIAEDEGSTNAIYLVCTSAGTKAPPHDHRTWAAIAGLVGEEYNALFERVDDGSVLGRGEVRELGHLIVKEGDCVSFMPEDIHSIEAKNGATRHLHWYGKGFAKQVGKVLFMNGKCISVPPEMIPVDDSRRVL